MGNRNGGEDSHLKGDHPGNDARIDTLVSKSEHALEELQLRRSRHGARQRERVAELQLHGSDDLARQRRNLSR